MTQDQQHYFPSEASHTQEFYALKNPSALEGSEPANLGSSGKYDNHWTTGVNCSDGKETVGCGEHCEAIAPILP